MQQLLDTTCHTLSTEDTLSLLDSSIEKGLDKFEIESRRERFGYNTISERKGPGLLLIFLRQFNQPMIYVLMGAAIVTAFLREWVDAGVIFGVVFINSIVGFIQENKAVSAIKALSKSLSSEATVRRFGTTMRISASELLPGDIVLLQSGDRVPADLRLLTVRDLQIDESALTGESIPVIKTTYELPSDIPLTDRTNMAFSSSLVTYGIGTGIVLAIGDSTEIGRISELASTAEMLQTPLTRRISQLSHILLIVILVTAAITFFIGFLRGSGWHDSFMASVALAVGAIPEGLPATLTIILAIGVSRMARRNAIIRNLPAVETLGSTTIICSDKTGTLTENAMTVEEIYAGEKLWNVGGSGYSPEGQIESAGGKNSELSIAVRECLICGVLCNDSFLFQKESAWKIEGDPTEGALLVSGRKAGVYVEELSKEILRLDHIPFESQNQYMATLHSSNNSGARIAYIKGSFEVLMSRCSLEMTDDGNLVDFNPERVAEAVDSLALKGYRVLAFAKKDMPYVVDKISHEDITHGLQFLGLQAMIDPPRKEVPDSIRKCQDAGIKVKMITGDHALTACVIASKLGIAPPPDEYGCTSSAITGQDLKGLTDEELIDVADKTMVFARVTPEIKLRLVKAHQAKNHIVAMTGDGVNDAPALRQANIGISMGMSGTEAAREASDMILANDNFSTIEAAVEEGRGVFDNILKYLVWTLPTNGGEGLVILLAMVLGMPLPVLPLHILWINMTTAVCLGLMLAFEPKEPALMNRHPRNPSAPILGPLLLIRITMVSLLLCAGAFGLYYYELSRGITEITARTVAATVFIFGEMFYLFNCRSLTRNIFKVGLFSNPYIWLGIFIMILLQLGFIYMPFMNKAFHTAPITGGMWIRVIVVGFMIFVIVTLEKTLLGKLMTKREATEITI
jgi:cation-transporting P-type ATPase F